MRDIEITTAMLRKVTAEIPTSLQHAVDPAWLSPVLAHLSGGAAILDVELVEEIRAMAAKVRVAIRFANTPDDVYRLCIKGFLDYDLAGAAANITAMREALFYAEIGPQLSMRIPACVAVAINRDNSQAILVMAGSLSTMLVGPLGRWHNVGSGLFRSSIGEP